MFTVLVLNDLRPLSIIPTTNYIYIILMAALFAQFDYFSLWHKRNYILAHLLFKTEKAPCCRASINNESKKMSIFQENHWHTQLRQILFIPKFDFICNCNGIDAREHGIHFQKERLLLIGLNCTTKKNWSDNIFMPSFPSNLPSTK